MVLDGAGDDVLAAAHRPEGGTTDGGIVALGAAAGENDVVGAGAEHIGDLTAGAVMMSTRRPGLLGDQSSGNMIQYGLSVTEADIIMADGQSLEHVGVTPDLVLLPTASDLRVRRDPVLARAIELAGGRMSPEKAGMLFPPEAELKSTR